ncbi:hypothetical protein [Thalassiella azotivora]
MTRAPDRSDQVTRSGVPGLRVLVRERPGPLLGTGAAVLALVVSSVLLLLGAVRTGVGVDEPTHVDRLQQLLRTGWYVPSPYMAGGAPLPDHPVASPDVYGPAYSALAQALNVLLGHGTLQVVSTSAEAYAVRHVVVALLGLLAAVAVGLTTHRVTAARWTGLWGAGALLAVPVWSGYSTMNPKDVPVAVGYTLVTAGCCVAVTTRTRPPRRTVLLVAGLLGAGTFLGVGTRTAMWAPFALSAALAVALVALRTLPAGQDAPDDADAAPPTGRTAPRGRAAVQAWLRTVGPPSLVAVVAGTVMVLVLHPGVASNPVAWLVGSVRGSLDYAWEGTTLTAGVALPRTPPWWYLPAWTLASVPLLHLVLAGLAAAATGAAVAARVRGGRTAGRPAAVAAHGLRALAAPRPAAVLLVLCQVLALPSVAVVTGAVLYDQLRQHLYVLPGLAVLAAVGAHAAVRWASSRGRGARWGVAAGLVVAVTVPVVDQVRLFPYAYAWVSPVAAVGGVDGRWETDSWWLSGREALTRVPAEGPLYCAPYLPPADSAGAPFHVGDCASYPSVAGVFAAERGSDVQPEARTAAGPGSGWWLVARARNGGVPPQGCRDAGSVRRPLHTGSVVLSYVLWCPDGTERGAGAAPAAGG